MSDQEPEALEVSGDQARFQSPPQWLQVVIVLTALMWGTIEVAFLGARPGSFAFIWSVLGLTLGVRALGSIREVLR